MQDEGTHLQFSEIILFLTIFIDKNFIGLFRAHSSIYDGILCENSWRLLTVNYFRKKASS